MKTLVIALLALVLSDRAFASECKDNYPHALDVGIYWASSTSSQLTKSCTYMQDSPVISSDFDPFKPSMVFVHGAQPEIVERNYERTGMSADWYKLVQVWQTRGWNVGFFQWGQFADEPIRNFERAQAKIWSTTYFSGMEYTYSAASTKDGSVSVGEASIKYDVSQILADAIKKHGFQTYGNELRLVGHSLGTQLVTRTAYLLMKEDINVINRITLLDPVFSSLPQGFLFSAPEGMIISNVLGQYAMELARNNVATEVHASSKINSCLRSSGSNTLLMKNTAYVRWIFNKWGEQSDVSCYGEQLWGDPAHLKHNANAMAIQIAN